MGRLLAIALVVATALTLASAAGAKRHDAFQRTIGVVLGGENLGACPVLPPATVRRCTLAQSDRRIEGAHTWFGAYPRIPGHIVRFRVHTGIATPDTTAVALRFRVLDGARGPGGPASRWFGLPLDGTRGRRLHEFPVQVPFAPGDQIAVDVAVRGNGRGEAAAPLVAREDPPWGVAEWSPPLGAARRPPQVLLGGILSLNAVFERDDQTPPRLRWKFARRQDFLRTGRVVVFVRGDERALLNPEVVLQVPDETWGMDHGRPHLRPHRWTRFVSEIEPPALHAGRMALRRGGKVSVAIRLVAYDHAGNVRKAHSFQVLPVGR